MSSNMHAEEGIAIIGMAGRFPGARNIDEFWINLVNGKESVSTFSDEECRASGVPDILLDNPNFIKRGGVLADIDLFDASFFDYSPREATYMDPQHRIFLECAYEAIENAGYYPGSYDGAIGVYAGCGINNYLLKNLMATAPQMESVITPLTFFGNDKDFLTTRVSYKLNLTGPSIAIQTACSTSLIAIQLACQGLLTYQCDIALSGGVSLQTPRMKGYLYLDGQILSSDGYCRAFDKYASGTVFGEGAGIVVLKRLEDAIADRDNIYAVIRGIAANNDGSEKAGFTAPSVEGQASVIALAHGIAGIDADDISYIETHGTGTKLGDPIEIEGLTQAFRLSSNRTGYCAIGSVKPNIGHLDVAAGIASVIKTALALKHKKIPASISYSEANPELQLETTPFFVNNQLSDWETNGKPRIAGVSSFGIGGTNSHAVIQEAPSVDSSISHLPCHLLLLSAKTEPALTKAIENLQDHISRNPSINLADAAYTLMVGRNHYPNRNYIVCSGPEDASRKLGELNIRAASEVNPEITKRLIVFMFSGQGTQYPQMARELYKYLPAFKEELDRCTDILSPLLDLDLRDIIYPGTQDESAALKLNETWITQPALFSIEYACAKALMSFGIVPDAMIGHSIGEYVAACLSGVFTLEDALSLIATRGRLVQNQERGSMLAIQLSEEKVLPFMSERLSMAAINSSTQCVVSGPDNAIEEMLQKLQSTAPNEKKISCIRLKTSHAFHSYMLEPAAVELKKAIRNCTLQSPSIPFVSNVTGDYIKSDQATDPDYWARHLTQTVRFSEGIQTILQVSDTLTIEIGPGTVLTALTRQHLNEDDNRVVVSTIRHRDQRTSDLTFFMNTFGRIWAEGINVDWNEFYKDESRMRIPLPTHPFIRERFWIEPDKSISDEKKKPARKNKKTFNRPLKKPSKKTVDISPDNVEIKLLNIWQNVLGSDSITLNDDFFELGGHSLLAAQLFAQIETTFGKNIPLSSLYKASTIAKLSELLKDDSKVKWSNIVPIRPGGKDPPLFLVHGAEGNVLLYRSLAEHLGDDQPVYGIQADGLDGSSEINADFKTVANKYLKQILEVQPTGPYYLAGYCLGGTISLEIAQQLQAMGQKVNFLGMIEIYNVQSLKNWPFPLYLRLYNKFFNVWYHLLNGMLSSNGNGWSFIIQKAAVQWRRIKISFKFEVHKILNKFGLNTGSELHHIKVDEAFDKALDEYHLEKFAGQITIFVPKRLPAGYTDAATYGFGDIAQLGVNRIEIPVYPRGTLTEPFVRYLAEKLKTCLVQAAENSSKGHINE